MKKLFGTTIAIIGGGLLLYSAYAYFIAGTTVFGVHALYPALGGVALATGGLIMRSD